MVVGPPPRTVTYSKEYADQARAIEPDYRRLDEFMRGAEWALARTDERGLVRVVLNPGGGLPRLDVWAKVTDNEAVVTGIEVSEV